MTNGHNSHARSAMDTAAHGEHAASELRQVLRGIDLRFDDERAGDRSGTSSSRSRSAVSLDASPSQPMRFGELDDVRRLEARAPARILEGHLFQLDPIQAVVAEHDHDQPELSEAASCSSDCTMARPPSPVKHTTGRSGWSSFAVIAPGSEKPIDESPFVIRTIAARKPSTPGPPAACANRRRS